MWKKGGSVSSLTGVSSIVQSKSHRYFSTALSFDNLFKLDSHMWSTSRRLLSPYLPISYGGSTLTGGNALYKLRTLSASNCLARTMNVSEFDQKFPLFAGTTKVPSGLRGYSQLVKYKEDGTVDIEKTEKAFKGHHKQTGESFEGSALSFSHQWTIYHLCSLLSGKTSIVLADQTSIPDDIMHIQGGEGSTGFDPSGTPDTFSFEHEVTVQDLPVIAIPGRLHRQGFKLVFSANPYFIDLKNKSLPEEIKSMTHEAVQSYIIASACERMKKRVPGHPFISMGEAAHLQKKAIELNISVIIDTVEMSSTQKDVYYATLQELRGKHESVHYTHIEIEEEPKEQDLEVERESSVTIEEITDEESEALEKSKVEGAEDEDTGPKIG